MPSHLPPEVWAQIATHCSPKTLKSLSLVCRLCRVEALRRLYQSVHFCEGSIYWQHPAGTPERTRIADLSLFYQSLTTWIGWRDVVQDVRLEWSHGLKRAFDKCSSDSETEAQLQLDALVRQAANLLSQSSRLRILHLSLPCLDSSVPFHIDRITSLRIPITCGEHEKEDPGFATLLKLFQLPHLHRIEIEAMLRLCCVIPPSCRQPGTSNVKELKFITCGPISEELIDLLLWPKDLQSLEFDISYTDGRRIWTVPNVSVTSEKMINTVSPLKHSLQNLEIYFREMDYGPYQKGAAFKDFSTLKRLKLPSEIFIKFSDDEDDDADCDIVPPLHTQLPETLQELHIILGVDFEWRDDDDDEDEDEDDEEKESSISPHPNALHLFTYLSTSLTTTKKSSSLSSSNKTTTTSPSPLPNLHTLFIHHDDYNPRIPPTSQPCYFPPICPSTRSFIDSMTDNGINVVFNENGLSGVELLGDIDGAFSYKF